MMTNTIRQAADRGRSFRESHGHQAVQSAIYDDHLNALKGLHPVIVWLAWRSFRRAAYN